MRKEVLYLTAMVAIAVFAWSCSTKDSVTPVTPSTYTFKINGHSFTQNAAVDSAISSDGSSYTLHALVIEGQATDKSQTGLLELVFTGSGKPKAGVYKVVGSDATDIKSNEVGLLAFTNISKAEAGILASTGADNVSITISISSSGKLSAVIPETALKGTNFDNTDPKNTVTTDVTGSASGSASE